MKLKALIASGGRGTRLRPITHTQNKHLIPIANKPILHYAIEAAAAAGITEVGIVTNAGSDEVMSAIGNGEKWGIRITYIPQEERFGVPEIRDGMIVKVEEKPEHPKSNYAVAGIYIYDRHIFEAVNNISPSARGELEISDAHQYLIDHWYKIGFSEITGWWKDTGKPTDLLEANRLILENIDPCVDEGVEVDSRSDVAGRVILQKGCKIMNSKVRGPAIIV